MINDLTNQRFGQLVVIGFDGRNSRSNRLWRCACECGEETIVVAGNLTSGNTKSCGCLQRKLASATLSKRNTLYRVIHGLTGTPEFYAFHSAKRRCVNPNDKFYPAYGGRGIQFRFDTLQDFVNAVGRRPPNPSPWSSPKSYWSLDRIDNDGHYEIGNVRWTDPVTQSQNRKVKYAKGNL